MILGNPFRITAGHTKKKNKTEKTKNSRSKCLREALPLEKLPSNMEAPTKPAKLKQNQPNGKPAIQKNQTVIKRTRNNTRQSVSYHRCTYREQGKPRKLKKDSQQMFAGSFTPRKTPLKHGGPDETR